jgi:hypothetical protein
MLHPSCDLGSLHKEHGMNADTALTLQLANADMEENNRVFDHVWREKKKFVVIFKETGI